jgi:Fe-S cluster biogenesis protein NfuA
MMTSTFDVRQFQTRLERLDALLREAENAADPAAQAHSRALVQAVLDLHAAGLERLLSHLDSAGDAGAAILDACARDEVVAGLLLLHGLHPLDLETRLHQALDQVRPYLRSHGGNVELLGICDGIVQLRLHGSCHSCPSSAVTMQQTIEEAIYAKAPEVTAVEVESGEENSLFSENGRARVALPML